MDIRRRLMMKALNSPDIPDTEEVVLPYLEADGMSYVETDLAFSSEFAIINVLYGKEPNTSGGPLFTFHNGNANFCMVTPNGTTGVSNRRPLSNGSNVIVEHHKDSSIQAASYILLTSYIKESQGFGSYFSTFTTPLDTETLPYGNERCYQNYLETPAAYTSNVYMRILGNRLGAPVASGLKFVRTTIENNNGELLHDLIPVKLNGQLGIKDKITDKFWPFITH